MVAGVDAAQADAAIVRGSDAGQPQQPLCIGHLCAVQFALRGVGAHLRLGGVQLLPGHGFLARQCAVAL